MSAISIGKIQMLTQMLCHDIDPSLANRFEQIIITGANPTPCIDGNTLKFFAPILRRVIETITPEALAAYNNKEFVHLVSQAVDQIDSRMVAMEKQMGIPASKFDYEATVMADLAKELVEYLNWQLTKI